MPEHLAVVAGGRMPGSPRKLPQRAPKPCLLGVPRAVLLERAQLLGGRLARSGFGGASAEDRIAQPVTANMPVPQAVVAKLGAVVAPAVLRPEGRGAVRIVHVDRDCALALAPLPVGAVA